MKSLILFLVAIAASPSFAAESDLLLFNQLKQAGAGTDEYSDPSQSNVVVAPLLCTVNESNKSYSCTFSDLSYSPVSQDPLEIKAQGALAEDLFGLLLTKGFEPKIFPHGFIVEATEITCIQMTDASDNRSLADRTTCDLTK